MPPTAPLRSPAGAPRLAALDAMRGFAMFWLIGGEQLLKAIAAGAEPDSWRKMLQRQFTYAPWGGYHFYDVIMPLFLFALGAAIPLSLVSRGGTRRSIVLHALRRCALLIVLGWCVSGNLLSWRLGQMSLGYSILQMLALAYLLAVLAVLYTGPAVQIGMTIGVLVAYWAVQMFVHVPGHEAGQFIEGRILSDWLHDATLAKLGAPLYSAYGWGWPLWFWNCGAMAMLGVFAIYIARPDVRAALRRMRRPTSASEPAKPAKADEPPMSPSQRLLWLGVLSAACLAAGWGWSYHLPLVRSRWTSSYVLWSAGWAYGLFALLVGLLELRGIRRGFGLLLAIGGNSILAYLIATVFPTTFESTAEVLLGGFGYYLGPYTQQLLMTAATYLLVWLLLVLLRRQSIYLRV